ncbi:MAG: SCO family protein [Pirellulaceae bacterium]
MAGAAELIAARAKRFVAKTSRGNLGRSVSSLPSALRICLNQNAKVQELQEKYRGQPLRLLSISCDPEVDRPKVLAEYAKRFDADPKQWLFLTGEMDYIARWRR